jgi:hypothetical protein
MKEIHAPGSEESLYALVRDLIVSARQTVAREVDLVQVRTNFQIGIIGVRVRLFADQPNAE